MAGGHPRFLFRPGGATMCSALALLAFLAWGCAVDLGFEKRDGWPDVPPDDTTEVDPDVPVDDGPPPECGNGEIDTGEECDGDPDRPCTTECGSEGTERCIECAWVCEPPAEVCNGEDDDCDDLTDESGELAILHGPTRITNDPGASEHPTLAWSSTEFGLVWQDDREGDFNLDSTILDPSGGLTDGVSRLFDSETSAITPAMVWAGGVFNVVFTDAPSGETTDVMFQRMDVEGVLTGAHRVVADEAAVALHNPALAGRTGGFMVVWDESFTVNRAMTNAGGNPTGAPLDLDGDPDVSRDADIAASGADFGVVWVDERDGNAELYATVMDVLGIPCDPLRLTEDTAASEDPTVVWDGSTYAVAWADARPGERDIFLTRFNPMCAKIGSDLHVHTSPGPVADPDLAWTGSELAIAWSNDGEIRFLILEDSGVPMTVELPVSEAGGDSSVPSLVYTGSAFGLAWQDTRDGNAEIYVAVIAHGECP